MNTKNIVWGALVTFTGGAILGAIITSEKSRAVRKKIIGKLDHYTTDVINRFDKIIGNLASKTNSAIKSAEQIKSE